MKWMEKLDPDLRRLYRYFMASGGGGRLFNWNS